MKICGFIVLFAWLFSACTPKIQVRQVDSNYPIILVKGKNVNKITTVKIPLVFHLAKSSLNDIRLGSISYWHDSRFSQKNSWQAGSTLYIPQKGQLCISNQLQKIGFVRNEFVVYTRYSTSYADTDEFGCFFQPYCDLMVESGKDTLHIGSLQDLIKVKPDIVRDFLQGDSVLFRLYHGKELIPYTCPVQVK